ncbi:MAG: SRPBCC family protein [Candidatus Krumholzibacteria bacterium]|nr:SRPBCC family protein [Candidatus Krumholzibacteria bacterium]
MRLVLFILLLALPAAIAVADQRTHIVEVDGQTIVVKITENIADVSTIRAECVIPRSHEDVWRVLTDYEHLEDIIPIVEDSAVIGNEDGITILQQKGRAGLWFFKRGFTVTFRVKEVPMAYIGFDAFEGDFRQFKGTWQVAAREEGTWIAHNVEIQPRFFAPGWAMGKVARTMMAETIEGVIQQCLSADVQFQ